MPPKPTFGQGLLVEHLDVEAGFLADRLGSVGELGREEVVRRGVDQVAAQGDGGSDRGGPAERLLAGLVPRVPDDELHGRRRVAVVVGHPLVGGELVGAEQGPLAGGLEQVGRAVRLDERQGGRDRGTTRPTPGSRHRPPGGPSRRRRRRRRRGPGRVRSRRSPVPAAHRASPGWSPHPPCRSRRVRPVPRPAVRRGRSRSLPCRPSTPARGRPSPRRRRSRRRGASRGLVRQSQGGHGRDAMRTPQCPDRSVASRP